MYGLTGEGRVEGMFLALSTRLRKSFERLASVFLRGAVPVKKKGLFS
ncbi:MAG TPA: hypothetical protein VGA63_08795 [Geopsychrobacteraceae bacterium]